ncbi:lysozyme inhibitor LprI family protein [Pseudothioclava nitratireducens]|uniref:lysozyme inhibitor LprI family protein n=1 Tax=Pseudothioclava nitratireducens TaxID=1928646 RepID=UPI0023DACC7E|nr:lysozyme inhibitor LprI family protein [Defluviimonas nitratireducens]MDF1620109.1 DUF1311 domain-containing protein [Defluviimonas nitratireducens]
MMRRVALLAAMLAGSAAWGQGDLPVAYDASVLEACLAAKSGDTRRDCIGIAANHCMQASDAGGSNAGMGFCLGAERDDWDARLNAAYQNLLEIEEALDKAMAEVSSAPQSAPALREMQRAWIAFRDAACDYEVTQWGGGSGGSPAWSACTMRLTGEQAIELIGRLGDKNR